MNFVKIDLLTELTRQQPFPTAGATMWQDILKWLAANNIKAIPKEYNFVRFGIPETIYLTEEDAVAFKMRFGF